MAKTVVGFFDSYEPARRALDQLASEGFDRNQISLITNRQTYRGSEPVSEASSEPAGAAVGAATGAVVGGSIGFIASMIPGVGPVLAIGRALATLFGAGVGAVAGGIIGILVEMGVPEADARMYEEGVRRGGTLLMLRADDSASAGRAAQIMNQNGAQDIKRRSADWQSGAQTKYAAPPTSPGAAASGASPPHPGEEQRGDQQRDGETRIPVVTIIEEEIITVSQEPPRGGDASTEQRAPGTPRGKDQGME